MDGTLANVTRESSRSLAVWARRGTVLLLALIVVAGAFGVFGVHARTVSANAGGYTLQVTYPQSARAGLDVPFRVHIQRDRALPKQITLAVTADYFGQFESQAFYPDAQSSTRDGTWLYLTYDTQPGSTRFVLDADTYVQPASQIGRDATIRLIADGQQVVSTHINTWLVP